MLRLLQTVWGWLTGGGGIQSLISAYAAKKDSDVERDRIEADLIKAQIDARAEGDRQAAEIRRATSSFWEMRLLTFLIAAPFVLHAGAVGIDTTFTNINWGIPAYPAPFDEWEGAILLSFFGLYTVGRGIVAAASLISSRRR